MPSTATRDVPTRAATRPGSLACRLRQTLADGGHRGAEGGQRRPSVRGQSRTDLDNGVARSAAGVIPRIVATVAIVA